MKSRYPLLLALLVPLAAWAEAPKPPADLPPSERVLQALTAHPSVRAAEAGLRGARARHEQLKAGDHEYQLDMTGNHRRVSDGPDYYEWGVGVSRGLRLPAKAQLDDQIGGLGVQASAEKVGDARHELAKGLVAAWYAARLGLAEAELWRRQVEILAELAQVTSRRVRRGDAARLDSLQADAALAQGRSQQRLAEARAQSAVAELQARYPELPAPGLSDHEPVLPEGDADRWLAQALAHNHELLAAQRHAEQGRLKLRRAEANTTPDPTLGVFYADENDHNEQVLGVAVTLALPGRARQAAAEMLRAEAEVLAEEEAGTIRRLRAETMANWQNAASSVASYAQLKAAAAAVGEHADLARRAYELGELGLTDTLQARRGALESRLAAEQARIAANAAVARLLLDAHQLWPLAEGEEHGQ